MAGEASNGEKVRQIVKLLPRVNCGHCGFGNCGGFALAVVEGKASPFGCEVHPLAGNEICKVLGIENPEEVQKSFDESKYGRMGIPTATSMGRGRGFWHHGGHHSHHSGHHKGGGRHHHRKHFL
jgi:Na+-translocating ferredoxin:NAD+ oxidoreductase RNF subunit RnfB